MKTDFRIEHIDPVGQGVSKEEGIITFIKKTLPGESVSAEIFSQKKGVQFARLLEIKEPSPERQVPECIHFEQCNGCDYQHTHYTRELEYKKNALARHLAKFPGVKINVHGAKKRTAYRNRIQLHYDKKKKILGMFDYKQNIIPVPECKIIDPSLAFELRSLYLENRWLKVVEKAPVTGHIELYRHEKNLEGHSVKVSVNRPYADGGFTQVNAEMNHELQAFIEEKATKLIMPKAIIYDLFGGNGNLSQKFKNPTLVVDKYGRIPENKNHQKFFSLDLYDKNAVRSLIQLSKDGHSPRPDWLIIDPPRSGLKNLGDFLKEFKPKGFIFIACQATSFARDTFMALNDYELREVELFDLFPGTQHFETVGVFTRRTKND